MRAISRQAKGLRPSGLTNQPQGIGGTAESDIGGQAVRAQPRVVINEEAFAGFGNDLPPKDVDSPSKSDVLEQARSDLTLILEQDDLALREMGVFGVRTQDEILNHVYEWVAGVACLPPAEILQQVILRAGRIWGPTLVWDWWRSRLIDTTDLRELILEVWSWTIAQRLRSKPSTGLRCSRPLGLYLTDRASQRRT